LVDGYITGRDPGAGRGLGDGGKLFDWYIEDAVAAARAVAGDNDVALMGGGGGRPVFQSLPGHVQLRLLKTVSAPGVTHLHHEVAR
jgi:hypothetical protein